MGRVEERNAPSSGHAKHSVALPGADRSSGQLNGLRTVLWWTGVLVFGLGVLFSVVLHIRYRTVFLPGDLTVPFAAYGAVGAIVARRRPENQLGWIFLAVGALAGVTGAAGGLLIPVALSGAPPSQPQVISLWLIYLLYTPMMVLATTFTALLFPDGLLSPRWRLAAWLAALAGAVLTVQGVLTPTMWIGEMTMANPFVTHVDSASQESPWHALLLTAAVLALVSGIAAVCSTLLRYHRSQGIERLQMRWFTSAIGLLLAWMGLNLARYGLGAVIPPGATFASTRGVIFVLLSLVPISCGIAILKYRLFEIDRIISRTLTYSLLTAILLGVYSVAVASASRLLPQSSNLGVAFATLMAAAVFRPALTVIQRRVDRRFNRERYDAERTVDTLAHRLRDQITIDGAANDLLIAVEKSLQPASVGLWLRPSSPRD